MSILSLSFVIFVLAALIIYFLTPGKFQWLSLLVISYVFYYFAGIQAVIFILVTTTTTFFAGKKIGKINDEFDKAVAAYKGPNPKMSREEKKTLKAEEDKRKKVIMIGTLILNFGILVVLKYTNPLVDLLNGLCSLVGIRYTAPHFSLLVPLGISYYTFQAMGYTIDLYRRKYKPETHFGHFMLFLAFFPQLIQGPVSRHNELAEQLVQPHRFDFTRVKNGLVLVLWGLFKKLIISDRLAIMTGTIIANPEQYGGYYLVVMTVLSTFQLYTDFSGGIDMMRGVAEAFGIILPENFTRPFFSINLAEYWRRWHITMNTWWRDYIFYPLTLSKPFHNIGKKAKKLLGDNFSKKLPILLSVIIIRIINAIWHGATAFNVCGGLYHGILLALSFYFEPHLIKLTKRLRIRTDCFSWRLFQYFRTFIIVAAPKVFQTMRSFSDLGNCLHNVFRVNNPWILFDGSLYQLGVSRDSLMIISLAMLTVLVVSAIQEKGLSVREELDKQNKAFRWLVYLLLIFSICLFGTYGSGYDASSFVYQLI